MMDGSGRAGAGRVPYGPDILKSGPSVSNYKAPDIGIIQSLVSLPAEGPCRMVSYTMKIFESEKIMDGE